MSKKNSIKKIILVSIIIMIVILNIYTLFILKERKKDENNNEEILNTINNNTDIKTTTPSPESKINILDVDLTNLTEINSDTKGYLKVDGTNISYPFVQATNNEFYLNHSFDKSENNIGFIFLDYRNDIDNLDNNTILYGHNRLTGSMFGSLKKLLNKDYQNSSNHYIYISSFNHNYVFEVFSTYITSNETYYLQTNFKDNNTYNDFLTTIKNRSTYNFNVDLTSTDKILTLSTCSGLDNRLVVHAKLIYQE